MSLGGAKSTFEGQSNVPKPARKPGVRVCVPAVAPVVLKEDTAANQGMNVAEKVKKCAP